MTQFTRERMLMGLLITFLVTFIFWDFVLHKLEAANIDHRAHPYGDHTTECTYPEDHPDRVRPLGFWLSPVIQPRTN